MDLESIAKEIGISIDEVEEYLFFYEDGKPFTKNDIILYIRNELLNENLMINLHSMNGKNIVVKKRIYFKYIEYKRALLEFAIKRMNNIEEENIINLNNKLKYIYNRLKKYIDLKEDWIKVS
jgi:hypothetical protein